VNPLPHTHKMLLDREHTLLEMNKLGHENCPFLFIIGYDTAFNYVIPLHQNNEKEICWSLTDDDISNICNVENSKPEIKFKSKPPSFENFQTGFNYVHENLLNGNSFLCNLTASSELITQNTLLDFYTAANAKFKLWVKDSFTCFSPEAFIKINTEGIISSFPMKGTINAKENNAKEKILNNQKERFEHTTIVDLIRNDLSKICTQVWVERFRYFDSITKENGEILLQVSSEVKGKLAENWKSTLGNIIFELLPAGSITGAPKTQTQKIIQVAEKELHKDGKRNYYTGIFGIFDGQKLSSSVMIRFIEQNKDGSLVFKSGGGVTNLSSAKEEYEELKQKIYVPIF
jgi:para-aminobenzoate synthetase component I